jgi:transcriptional regulator with XRE-family HTH domain
MTIKKWYGPEDLEKRLGPMTFGRFVKAFREADEISQSDYAKKLKITRANLCDIEKGRRPITLSLAVKIAKAIGVPDEMMIILALEDQLRREKLSYKVELKSA